MTERHEKHITANEPGVTVIALLANNTPLSKQKLKNALANGAVWLESQHGVNRIRREKKEIKTGRDLTSLLR